MVALVLQGLVLLRPSPPGEGWLIPTIPSGALISKRQTEVFLGQQGQAAADVRWTELGRAPGPLPLSRDELPADFRLTLPGYRPRTLHVDRFPLPGPVRLEPVVPGVVPLAYALARDYPGLGLALVLGLAGLISARRAGRARLARAEQKQRHQAGAFRPGDPVGPYLLGELLGQGASGQVFACGPDKAIKLYFQAGSTPEVQALRQLRHPNLLFLYDWGEHEGTEYVVMERVEGGPPQPGMEPEAVRRLGTELLAGLAELHRLGLVHRDVKPANLMLTARGVKLMDFSLASPAPAVGRVGTPGFMAPEQIRGEAADPRSDLYAVGAVLAYAMSGPPFQAATALAVMERQQQGDWDRPQGPPELLALLEGLLQTEPARRLTAGEAAARLRPKTLE